MRLLKSVGNPSFPRKRESRGRKFQSLALDPRFRGGDERIG
jgi:hypothetical protein